MAQVFFTSSRATINKIGNIFFLGKFHQLNKQLLKNSLARTTPFFKTVKLSRNGELLVQLKEIIAKPSQAEKPDQTWRFDEPTNHARGMEVEKRRLWPIEEKKKKGLEGEEEEEEGFGFCCMLAKKWKQPHPK